MASVGLNEVRGSQLGTGSNLEGVEEADQFPSSGTLAFPPAPAPTTPTDAISVISPQSVPLSGELSVREWKLVAQEHAHSDPDCSLGLYRRALGLFERALEKIVSGLAQSLDSKNSLVGQQLESSASQFLHGDKSSSASDLEVEQNPLARNADSIPSLKRVVDWVDPAGIIAGLKVSWDRDNDDSMRLFLRNGKEALVTIVLDNKAGSWVVGDIFFFGATEISREFIRLQLYTQTPLVDNVLSSRSPTR